MWYPDSRVFVKWMTFFTIVQLPLYFVFVPSRRRASDAAAAAASDNPRDPAHKTHARPDRLSDDECPAAIGRLHNLRSFAVRYNQFFQFNYAVAFVRAALIHLMGVGLLPDYHLADCFIMGRTILLGKTHRFSAIFATFFYIMYAGYRNYLGKYRPGFKFHAIEFILHDYDEILAHEVLECKSHRGARRSNGPGEMQPYKWSMDDYGELHQPPRRIARSSSREFLAVSSMSSCHRRRAVSLNRKPAPHGSPTSPVYLEDKRLDWCNHIRTPREVKSNEDWLPTKNPLLYIRNTFVTEESEMCDIRHRDDLDQREPGDEYILRLNRTTKCWTILNRFALIASLLSIGGFINILFLSWLIFLGPLLTEFGFETSYSSCVRYLKRVQQAAAAASNESITPLPYAKSIYLAANKTLACDIHLDEMPLFYLPGGEFKTVNLASLYHSVRMTFDLYESYMFNLGFMCYLSAISFTIFILALDVVLNAREIRKRMVVIVAQLRRWQELQELTSCNHLLHEHELGQQLPACQLDRHRLAAKRLRRDILVIQEILVDHFKLVGQYNSYVSLTLILTLTLLLCISVAFMVIIFTYKSPGIAVEYFVGEIGSIFLIIYLFTGLAATRATNVHLHSLISRAMALDCSQSVTKLRWAIIMKHYHPKPLYCFTLLERTELSWLFCLKFASWSLSAVFVLAGFLYPR